MRVLCVLYYIIIILYIRAYVSSKPSGVVRTV